jgi:hypothetical protein
VARTKGKRSVIVGESWPNGIEVVSAEIRSPWREPKVVIITGIASLMGLLFVAFITYAMITQDQELLNKIFSAMDRAFFIVLGWTGAKAAVTERQSGP